MTARPILLLGDERLFEPSALVSRDEVPALRSDVAALHATMRQFQQEHGWGRAIAAPQIGVHKRIVAMHVHEPVTFYNPVLQDLAKETVDYWEDCMSFPDLVVHVRMPKACRLVWRDADWQEHAAELTGDYAALLQHEVDHLDGVLATQRAIDDRSVALRATRGPKDLAWNGEFRPLGARRSDDDGRPVE